VNPQDPLQPRGWHPGIYEGKTEAEVSAQVGTAVPKGTAPTAADLRREQKRIRKALLQSSSENTVDSKRTPE